MWTKVLKPFFRETQKLGKGNDKGIRAIWVYDKQGYSLDHAEMR